MRLSRLVQTARGSALALAVLCAGPLAASPILAARAFAADPAADRIEAFDGALIKTMQAGKAAGAKGRYDIIAPAVDSAFDLPVMVRFAVGPTWSTFAPADQQALLAAFRRFTIANWAKNFDSYGGQKIAVAPDVQTRGVDKLVKAQLTGSGDPVTLAYRMRDAGAGWKVIDVYYNGNISQLTTQRSDFAATLSNGGAKALTATLNAKADKLLRG